eukprot:gnl/MRDRNA2_/MRDRNA2_60230_c0_seq1.p1 gnl/MRDRNA2_/MRDRNA2_60230_c0~~gnl/MRDRNA2_/MRDRNA2_60230_c0_seq1.p1  ORF type:complete len:299 (+),score=73.92 gnl/MRDRNA2_/MRDRNA2_60230_c0_seq1:97-993(+)
MSVLEEEQRQEITRLTSQVEQLQQQLRSVTAEAEQLRNSANTPDSEQLQTVKAELDHERQKAKAIWAAVRTIGGEEAARRIEEEVSRRPIVAGPKARRRGTMPHMTAPHITVVAKTAATPKWPPTAQEEVTAVPEASAKVLATVVPEDHSEGPKPEFGVDSCSVPPSVARRLFDLGFKGKDQKEASCSGGEPLSLKLDDALEPQSARVADVPSPMRRRESSTSSLSSVPPQMPRQQCGQRASIRSVTPTGPVLNRKEVSATPPPLQVAVHKPSMATPTSVRDRVRQLELSARRNSIQS